MTITFTFPTRHLAWLRGLSLGLALVTVTAVFAADPQPYTVTIANTGDAELDKMLKEACTLISLNGIAPVGSFAMVARARADVERFITALHSLGYYQGTVAVSIAQRPLADRGLYDTIDYAPEKPPVPVEIRVEKGPLFHLRSLVIDGDAPADAPQWLGLKSLAPARAADVQLAREKLQLALQEHGYALAKVDEPVARLLPDTNEVDVTYRVVVGAPATVGQVTVKGLANVNKNFVDKHLQIRQGQAFTLSSIEKNRLDLQNMGVFASVRTQVGDRLDAQKQLPITFMVSERLRHTTQVGAAYSTDLGASVSGYWQHHNLRGYGEQLNLTAGITQIGGNSTTGIGYNVAATYLVPDFRRNNQTLQLHFANFRQSLSTYDQDAVLGEVQLSRKLTPSLSGSIGLGPEQSTITQAGETHDYTLASLPLTLKYDTTNSLLDPTRGSILNPSVTPIIALTASELHTFVMMQLSASTYWDADGEGRSVLAVRGLLGNIAGAGRFDLPPDKRFYAGGSNTVRGFRYQSIGPQFADGNPQGGKAIATATVEFRQRILDNYGIVAFTDAGQVSPDMLLTSGDWRIGAGLGARYYTSFGPLRLDFALPINPQSNSGSFEIYLGLGQAF